MPTQFEIDRAALRQARKDAGLGIAQVAIAINRVAATVIRYEQGHTRPSLDALAAMARLYGHKVEDFRLADNEPVAF